MLCEVVKDESDQDVYRMLTLRNEPRMGLINTSLDGDILRVSVAENHLSENKVEAVEFVISKSRSLPGSKKVNFKLHKADVIGIDLGIKASSFFSKFLGRNVRMIQRIPGSRLVVPKVFANPAPNVQEREAAFQDQFPLLIMSSETIEEINHCLGTVGEESLESERFRPNLILSGIGAFEEDDWQRITIAGYPVSLLSRCGRCLLPNVDIVTGQKSKTNQPYKLLSTIRKVDPHQPKLPVLGMHATFEDVSGRVRVGDTVTMVTRANG